MGATEAEAAAPPRLEWLLLFGDDQVLDLVVGGLRNHFFLHEIGLLGIGPAVDDLLGIGGADTRKRVELFLGGAVDVDEVLGRRAGGSGRRLLRGRRLGNGYANAQNQDESDEQNA